MSSSSSEEYKEEMIPMDIVIEILKRVPIKSVMRFMSVSKSWKSVIQSSRFIADYNRSSPPRQFCVAWNNNCSTGIFSDDGKRFLHRLTLPITGRFELNQLIGYSQGLFGFHGYGDPVTLVVVIWNPSIRKSVPIPLPDQRSCSRTDFGFTVCNATDPTVIMIGRRLRWQLEIFTLSTGDWRSVSDAPRDSLDLGKMNIVMDGFIHWIASDTTTHNTLILTFDIASEQFTELCLPPTLAAKSSFSSLKLSELRGSLVVLESKQEIGVWMMKEKSFRMLYTVKPPNTTKLPKALGFNENGQLIISVYRRSRCHDGKGVYSYDEEVYSYEPNLKWFNKIKISELSTKGPYMETLLLLDR